MPTPKPETKEIPAAIVEVIPVADSDGDGVVDSEDSCGQTLPDIEVDAHGCPLIVDSDSDGVMDDQDTCPSSPRGMVVDETGCTPRLDAARSFSLDLAFASNSSDAPAAADERLAEVLDLLRRYPLSEVAIEGHTDSVGNAQANLALSEARAQAVADTLVSLGIAANRVRATGYGESQPLASNDSPAGRAQNRRVVAVVEPGSR